MKTQMTEAEWREKGQSLFGPDIMKWKFTCPVCGHVASPEDFWKFKDKGADPDSATQECIGRYWPKEKRGGFSADHANQKVKHPCDYAGYGLLQLSPIEIVFPDGKTRPCFAFAETQPMPVP